MKALTAFLLSLAGLAPAASPAKTLLSPGSFAPDFTLLTQGGDSVTLSSFRGRSAVVLVFYPGDATPVCTRQLCAIRDDYSAFTGRSAVVFGVNPAGGESHSAFASEHSFPFPLLVDHGKVVTKLYGCDGLIMIQRTVYVISPEGKIVYAKRGNPPVSEILRNVPEPPGRAP